MIRESIARHSVAQDSVVAQGFSPANRVAQDFSPAAHGSFCRFLLARPAGDDACLIEPTVKCNHCGFCESYGH